MDQHNALKTSAEVFLNLVGEITATDWDRPTPCDQWTVRDLTNHVVGGGRMYAMLLDGASRTTRPVTCPPC